MLHSFLKLLGLNPAEARVYVTCLRSGTQDLETIAKEVGIERPDIVPILAGLLERGFVNVFKGTKTFYTAEPPSVLLRLLEEEGARPGLIRCLRPAIAELEKERNPSVTKPEIAFYEGKKGIIAAYEDTLTAKTDILAITSIDDTEHFLPQYVPEYYKRRATAGISIKAIFLDTPLARERRKHDAEEFRVSRLLPEEFINCHIELNIYDDKVAYFSIPEEIAIIVNSKLIAETMRSIFDITWRMAEYYENALRREKTRLVA